MRRAFFPMLCLSLLAAGCSMFSPNSRLNVNRGEYHDEADMVAKEGRAGQTMERAPDGLGQWLYDPKTRAINRNLGIED